MKLLTRLHVPPAFAPLTDEAAPISPGRSPARWIVVVGLGVAFGLAVVWALLPTNAEPASLVRGPMLQSVGPTRATIAFWMSRPTDVTLEVEDANGWRPVEIERVTPADASPAMYEARAWDLPAKTATPYRIRFLPPSGDEIFLQEPTWTIAPPHMLRPARVAVLGDSGDGSRSQQALADRLATLELDAIVHTGDVVYPTGADADYDAGFYQPYAAILPNTPIYPVGGNHDWQQPDLAVYRQHFILPTNGPDGLPPETCYYQRIGSALFVFADTSLLTDEQIEADLLPWLRETLSLHARWRIVVNHYPAVSVGAHDADPVIANRIVPVLEAMDVDLYLNGHNHHYVRTHPLRGGEVSEDGVVYITSGAGGADLYEIDEPLPPTIAAADDEVHSFTLLTIRLNDIELQQIDADGNVIDEWTMTIPPIQPKPTTQAAER